MSDGTEFASYPNQQVESTIVDELTLTEVDVVPRPPMSGDSNPQPLFGRITDQVAALPNNTAKPNMLEFMEMNVQMCWRLKVLRETILKILHTQDSSKKLENIIVKKVVLDLNTNVRDLELTIVQLTEKLGDQENEIEKLKKENSTLQDNQMKLRIQYDDEKKQYETEYAFMLDEKDRQFQHIFEDKDKQIKDLADEKEKLTDLINSNNTSISRQQQEELNRKINTNLMSLKEYQLKLAACENDIRIQNMQFLECQQALQKCNYDKQSDQEEYNKLLVSQKHYLEECQQKLLACENSKQIKYDEYNTLVKNINEANKYNIETLERLYRKPTLSNSDIIHCFSSIFPLDDDNESKETRKSQIEAIITRFISQLNTERENYIYQEREKDIKDRISRLNYYINNIESLQNNDLLNIFTNEEERNLFNQILEKFKTNIIDETKEIRQDLNANNVKRFYYIILNVIRKFPSDNIHEILALQQQNDLHVKTLQEENETITSNLLTIQQTNASLQDSNKQLLSELSETRMHLSMFNYDETSVDPIEYEETQMNKFTSIIQAVTTQLDAYLAGTCNNKYLRSAFDKLSIRKMFCKNEMAKSEMMQLFISLSNHIFKFIFCAQFYKNLVTLSQKYIYYENEHELLINHIHRKGELIYVDYFNEVIASVVLKMISKCEDLSNQTPVNYAALENYRKLAQNKYHHVLQQMMKY
ncbi:putative leucine-rich repeat-containing protein DDB_G0290503 [Procambarus clarkii]|uniref:putative leucine-rich repeat-containing protein DDB_G0290503 n=1 Tax=Procambarus clarkii TaxID=6728 RepID=UPI00374280AC